MTRGPSFRVTMATTEQFDGTHGSSPERRPARHPPNKRCAVFPGKEAEMRPEGSVGWAFPGCWNSRHGIKQHTFTTCGSRGQSLTRAHGAAAKVRAGRVLRGSGRICFLLSSLWRHSAHQTSTSAPELTPVFSSHSPGAPSEGRQGHLPTRCPPELHRQRPFAT